MVADFQLSRCFSRAGLHVILKEIQAGIMQWPLWIQVFYISEAEFWSEIKDDYVQKIAEMDPNEVYPSNNPGN